MKYIKLFEQFVESISKGSYSMLKRNDIIKHVDSGIMLRISVVKPNVSGMILNSGTFKGKPIRMGDVIAVKPAEIGEWEYSSLDEEGLIKLKDTLVEASLKGAEGIPSNKRLAQLSDNDKLKIVQSTGNLISFKVPDWSKGKRNFWTVISAGKIVKKKNLNGDIIFFLPGAGPEKVSPSYSSIAELLDGVDWDTMELRRESVNEKKSDDFTDYLSSRKAYSRPTNWKVIEKDGKYSFESDGFSRVRLMYNGKQIAVGVNDWSTGGYEIEHSSWKNKEKPFQFAKDIIDYFKSNKLTTESVNERKYYVTYNRGRGQGKGLEKVFDKKAFKSTDKPMVFNSYKDAKEYAEKMEKMFRNSIGGGTAYWVSDEKMNRVEESVNESDLTGYSVVKEETSSEIIKDLDKVKNDLLKKVDVLIAKKKKLYSNVDIESPMSADEKKLNKDIADLFSEINTLVLQKRSLKKASVNEAKFKVGDKWEWVTADGTKIVSITNIKPNGDIIGKEEGSSEDFIVRDANKYLKKKVVESVNENINMPFGLQQLMADEESEGFEAEILIGRFDGNPIKAQSTDKIFSDGVPVMKNFSRGGKKDVRLKGDFHLVDSSRGWWYVYGPLKTWYAIKHDDYSTPPFEL